MGEIGSWHYINSHQKPEIQLTNIILTIINIIPNASLVIGKK